MDLKVELLSKWADFFSELELRHGLDAGNPNHIWLLQYLFLVKINEEIGRFIAAWNNHKLRQRGQRARTPLDMFHFDMHVCGICGNLQNEGMDGFLNFIDHQIIFFYI